MDFPHGLRPASAARCPLNLLGYNSIMTEAQEIQYDRFICAGYSPKDAAMMIERGVWLGTQGMLPETVEDIQQYRRERDVRANKESEPP